jgi:cytochrome c-type biogenesis protein CcmE
MIALVARARTIALAALALALAAWWSRPRAVWCTGVVVHDTLGSDRAAAEHSFGLATDDRLLWVEYEGVLSDCVRDGGEVRVHGIVHDDDTVDADVLLGRCRSR